MPEMQRSATIAATPNVIWSIVADPGRASEWMPDVRERRLLTHGPLGVGSRWEERGSLHDKPYMVTHEITEWQPPTRFSYRQVDAKRNSEWLETVSLEPRDAGVRVTIALEFRFPGGLLGRLYERSVFRKDFALTLNRRLESLKERAEH